MRNITPWVLLASLGVFSATGCGDALGIEDVVGMWELRSINGNPVPGVVQIRGEAPAVEPLYIAFSRYTFLEQGRCRLTVGYENHSVTFGEGLCYYRLEGDQILLGERAGTVDDRTMTVTDRFNNVSLYERR